MFRFKFNRVLLAECVENLMLRDNDDFRSAFVDESDEFQKRYRDSLLKSYPAVVESMVVAHQDMRKLRWLCKEWVEYALGVGLTPTMISRKCRVPALAIRAGICYNGILRFGSILKTLKYIFTGHIPLDFSNKLTSEDVKRAERTTVFDNTIFVQGDAKIWLPQAA